MKVATLISVVAAALAVAMIMVVAPT